MLPGLDWKAMKSCLLPGLSERRVAGLTGKTKSSPNKSDELAYSAIKLFEANYLTYLSASRRMELAPFPYLQLLQMRGGCQGFIGPLPSAFLDK
jgi:hypothetical protein